MENGNVLFNYTEKGLLEPLYEARGVAVYNLADYAIVGILPMSVDIEDETGYGGLILDAEMMNKIKADRETFATYLTNKAYSDRGIVLRNSNIEEFLELKEKIHSGEEASLIDPNLLTSLKREYVETFKSKIDPYGDPPQFSSKSGSVFTWLSIFLTTYGVPFFYIGKPLLGLLFLIESFCFVVTMFPPLFCVDMLVFLFGAIGLTTLLSKGKIKDRNGRIVATEKKKKLVLYQHRFVRKYQEELYGKPHSEQEKMNG